MTVYNIPEEALPEIIELAEEIEILELKLKCLKYQIEERIKNNDAEGAFRAKKSGIQIQKLRVERNKVFWDKIHDALPQLDRDADYGFDYEDCTVESKDDDDDESSSPMSHIFLNMHG